MSVDTVLSVKGCHNGSDFSFNLNIKDLSEFYNKEELKKACINECETLKELILEKLLKNIDKDFVYEPEHPLSSENARAFGFTKLVATYIEDRIPLIVV